MKTNFHKKLESLCRISHRGDKHWLLVRSSLVRIPSQGGLIVTVKRAVYAAYIGPVLEGQDVVALCGLRMCVAPGHLGLRVSRRVSRALYLPDELEALSKPDVFQPPENPNVLPSGMTLHKVFLIKYLTKCANTLAQIRAAVGLPFHEIVKVRSGVYDQAVKNIRGAGSARKIEKSLHRLESPVDVPGGDAPPSELVIEAKPPDIVLDESTTEEERIWLATMAKG